MPHIILGDRSLISFSGPEAENLLHNVVTCNIETLPKGIAQICALLTPQGKIMFEFLVSRSGDDGFIVEIAREDAASFKQRMVMYRLRSKVEIVESTESLVKVSWDGDSAAAETGLHDTRFSTHAVYRTYSETGSATDRTEWDQLRITNGVPEAGIDYALGDAFPHDVSLDENQGVDFKKGCYIGQEVVSRMHHRHTARRRLLIAETPTHYDDERSITSDGKALGTLGTITGNQALALCRIDRVKDAMDANQPILVGQTPISLRIPSSANYGWPGEDNNG